MTGLYGLAVHERDLGTAHSMAIFFAFSIARLLPTTHHETWDARIQVLRP
jgi:hypothetical protein